MFNNLLILNAFQRYRMTPTAIDQYESVGKQILDDKISRFTQRNLPIEFSMLGFPFKSMNDRDKVIGKLPDLGERLTMENFSAFNESVKEVYSPGIKMNIVSDGLIFNDLMDVSDKTVSEYNEIAVDMAKVAPVKWYTAQDFYEKSLSTNTIREKVTTQFGISSEELEKRILLDPDVNFLYRGMIRFMEADLAIRPFDSGNQLHKAAKKLAREMMFRNEAYSLLVQKELTDAQGMIRLSMHPSVNSGAKYSFQLINSPNAWTSPWHCAIVKKDGSVATIHRKDAIAAGYELVNVDGRPFYFQA